ncbi:YdeI/OmpD-associated family protein [Patescibacteria group bacterium]|nr:YdeI/OmpD-associated family protein [Patescibacteria group bacterium]
MEKVPTNLRNILATNPKAKTQWQDLTPIARRDFISWIASAKQSETRKRRVESIPSRLASGKRRPCCYALVPMNLYTTLKNSPQAKAQWSDLTPDERRDFLDWINEPKESNERAQRITASAKKLASRKRHP